MNLTGLTILKLPILNITKKQLSQWLPISLILIFATGLRLYQLGSESLWVDEMFSILGAEKLNQSTRPLYFALLRVWMIFGTSDAWLRGLALLFGIGSIFFTYQLGRRLASQPVGLIAALLMTFSPLFINHSQEIRFYTLSTFLCIAGTLILSYLFERPSKILMGWWAFARALATLTTPLNVLMLIPDIILFSWRFRKERRWLLLLGKGLMIIGCFSLVPALVLIFGGSFSDYMNGGASNYPKPSIGKIISMLPRFSASWGLKELLASVQVLSQNTDSGLLQNILNLNHITNILHLLCYTIYTIVLIGLLVIALRNGKGQKRFSSGQLIWVATWGFLPTTAILFISYVFSTIWIPRYLLFIAPYLFILLAVGIVKVWHQWRSLAIFMVAAYIFTVSSGLVNYYTNLDRPDFKRAAQMISINEKPGDVIVAHIPEIFHDYSVARYYQGKAPLYNTKRPPLPQTFDRVFIKQKLGSLPPITGNLWLTCWKFCDNQEEINLIFEALVGQDFHVQTQKIFGDPKVSDSVKVFQVTRTVTKS
ncbi:MAG: glycosyltransferase family 39 protein [Calothrix sp. MO_167.B12]|nr:glycosyltransferase family 39 protein [Calothrix sp. MO_167.B12]